MQLPQLTHRLRRVGSFVGYWSSTLVFVTLAMVVGGLMILCQSAYCVIIRRKHDWNEYPETDYSPAIKECARCGRRG